MEEDPRIPALSAAFEYLLSVLAHNGTLTHEQYDLLWTTYVDNYTPPQ